MSSLSCFSYTYLGKFRSIWIINICLEREGELEGDSETAYVIMCNEMSGILKRYFHGGNLIYFHTRIIAKMSPNDLVPTADNPQGISMRLAINE